MCRGPVLAIWNNKCKDLPVPVNIDGIEIYKGLCIYLVLCRHVINCQYVFGQKKKAFSSSSFDKQLVHFLLWPENKSWKILLPLLLFFFFFFFWGGGGGGGWVFFLGFFLFLPVTYLIHHQTRFSLAKLCIYLYIIQTLIQWKMLIPDLENIASGWQGARLSVEHRLQLKHGCFIFALCLYNYPLACSLVIEK